jgi:hypothetical protein
MLKKEKDLKNQICDWLNLNSFFAYKNNSGVFFIKGKNRTRAFHSGIKGLPDITFFGKGLFGFVETKIGYKKLNPNQQEFFDKAKGYGALCILAYDLDDVIEVLKNFL